jgi:CoA:oxalate CoA-transferase
MNRLGYGWEAVHENHPQLIYASVSGFGQTGPYAERAAYDMVVQAMGGLMSLTGHPDGTPTRVGTSVGDITAGLFATVGILTALHDRHQTGLGQHVDVAMLDCQVAILENAIARYTTTGVVPHPLGSRHPSITPFGAFKTADGHVVIAAGNDDLFDKLCETLGLAISSDERFISNAGRTDHADVLTASLETALERESTETWLERLGSAGVPCGPINDIAAVLKDPQVRERNMIVTAQLPNGSQVKMAGNPIKLSAHDDPSTRPPAPA